MPRIELSVNGDARAIEMRDGAALLERLREGCAPTWPKAGCSPTGQRGCTTKNGHANYLQSSANTQRCDATAPTDAAHVVIGARKTQMIERAVLDPEARLAVLCPQWMAHLDVRSIAEPAPKRLFAAPSPDARSFGEIRLVSPALAVAKTLRSCDNVRRHALLPQDSRTARDIAGKKPIAAVPY